MISLMQLSFAMGTSEANSHSHISIWRPRLESNTIGRSKMFSIAPLAARPRRLLRLRQMTIFFEFPFEREKGGSKQYKYLKFSFVQYMLVPSLRLLAVQGVSSWSTTDVLW